MFSYFSLTIAYQFLYGGLCFSFFHDRLPIEIYLRLLCRIPGIREQYLEKEENPMCTGQEAAMIITELSRRIALLYPLDRIETILLGAYAIGDANPNSDIDALFLVNASRQDISDKNWQIGDLDTELLLEHGVTVSPLVKSRAYFTRNLRVFPFCHSVEREGRGSAPDITRVDLCPATKSAFNGGKNRLRQKGDSPWH